MINKAIVGILVFLALIMGGFCFYAYTLSQQINSLSEQLTVFQQEQAAQIGTVSNKLMNLRIKTLTRPGVLESPDEVVTLTLIRETAKLELSLKIGKRSSPQNNLAL